MNFAVTDLCIILVLSILSGVILWHGVPQEGRDLLAMIIGGLLAALRGSRTGGRSTDRDSLPPAA